MAKTWRLKKGNTWRQKLGEKHPSHGKIVSIPLRMRKRYGRGTMLIPRPLDVDALMKTPEKGRLITQSQLRGLLVRASGADHACPLTTGIFVRIAAEAAEEDRRAGRKRITPYWRTIRDGGRLNDKHPGGARAQAAKLRAEGFVIEPRKGRQLPRVRDYQLRLVKV